ncbi:hypothetical protein [Treponema sp.]|uniref:hypothetical protein n=1 Tax=Treponema sp. TaxID=166 RepID=UPI003EFDC322
MFIFYTLTYIVLTYIAYGLSVIGITSSYFSLIREAYFIYLLFLVFYKFLFKDKCVFKVTEYSKLLLLCLFLALPYIFISHYLSESVITFTLYFTGPILFLLISSLSISEKTRIKFEFYFLLVMGIICILNMFFYFIQDTVVQYLPAYDLRNFSRTEKMRFLGIAIHPTSTGFYFIYFVSYLLLFKKDKISSVISGVFFVLTGTRSAILGTPFYLFLKFKKMLKVLSLFFCITLLTVIYFILINGSLNAHLDGSALKHLMDFFVLGPEYMLKYPFGAGLGTVSPYNQENAIIHIESEMYLYMIQLGIFAFIIKMIFYYYVIKKLLLVNTRKANWLLFILLTFLVGCMFFPLNDIRFISNFIWIMLGIEFSKPEYRQFPRNKKHRLLKYMLTVGKYE